MSDDSGLINALKDLQRRKVFRAAAIYAAVAWLVTQVADVALPALNAPAATITVVVALAIVGFPVFVILAWFFDVNEDGIVRTQPGSAKGITAIATGLVLLVAGTFLFTRLIGPPASEDGYAAYDPIPNSIAVLAFADMSPNQDSEHMSDGISETLIHQLSQSDDLHVIARTSAFSFKGMDTDIRDIGRALDVEMVLEGSVQRSGGQFRIFAQLIDARSGVHIWSKQYDQPEEDIFQIQDEIAQSVAKEILAGNSDVDVSAPSTISLGAYELYLIGQQKFANLQVFEAVSFFEQAIESDPEYALAYTGLADALMGISRMVSDDERTAYLDRAGAAIDRAAEIDPDSAAVWASRILYRWNTAGDTDFALEAFNNAVELNPNYIWSYIYYGMLVSNSAYLAQDRNRLEEARTILEAGLSRDPRNAALIIILAGIANNSGDEQEAIRHMIDAYRFAAAKPLGLEAVAYLAWAEYQRGNLDRATAYAQIYVQEMGTPVLPGMRMEYVLAKYYMEMGQLETAEAFTQILREIEAPYLWVEGDLATLRRDSNAVQEVVRTYVAQLPGYEDPTGEVDEVGIVGYSAVYFAGHGNECELTIEVGQRVKFGPQPDPYVNMHLARCYAQMGNAELADEYGAKTRADLERVLNSGLHIFNTHHTIFETLTFLGEPEEALRHLELSIDKGMRWYGSLDRTTFTESIQDNPEYRALYERMKAITDAQRDRVLAAEASGDWYSLVDIEPREW